MSVSVENSCVKQVRVFSSVLIFEAGERWRW